MSDGVNLFHHVFQKRCDKINNPNRHYQNLNMTHLDKKVNVSVFISYQFLSF